MQAIKTQISILLISFVSLLSLNSCEEVWWNSSYDLDGQWRVVEVQGYSNYEQGDTWFFYPSHEFYALGSGNLREQGYWDQEGRKLYISFESYEPEIEAYIQTYDGDYLVLKVRDYTYGTSYTLRFVREREYSMPKQQ